MSTIFSDFQRSFKICRIFQNFVKCFTNLMRFLNRFTPHNFHVFSSNSFESKGEQRDFKTHFRVCLYCTVDEKQNLPQIDCHVKFSMEKDKWP